MKRLNFFILAFLFFNVVPHSDAQVLLQPAFPNLSFNNPLDLQHPGDGTDRIFVVTQSGVIYVFNNSPSVTSAKVFLDISDRVISGGELGLLGLAFHPDYKNNGYFYVNYTAPNPLRSIMARYTVSSTDPDSADKNSEVILLQVLQPYPNHNGGQLAFGPDGYLYIGLGDGGSAGDPQNNAQNRSVLLGKILRIDVNTTSGGNNYAIPPDNPFVGNTAGYKEEIYAYGLRNPWRFSFDPVTKWLWAGDVGQNLWEEIDLIEKGKNYGWRIMEGTHCYDPPSGCDTSGLTLPLWEYGHDSNGGDSVIGGYVYRGREVPELYGKYVYGDFVSGRIWTLSYDGINPPINALLLSSGLNIASFGVDKHNELYVCAFDGKIYKFTSVLPPPLPTPTPTPISVNWGIFGDIPVPEDYNGDNRADIAVWRPTNGIWYILPSGNNPPMAPMVQFWGSPGDQPVPGDYDGDGQTDLAVFQPSRRTWLIQKSRDGISLQRFGNPSDIPVPKDYDGDKITDLAVFRPLQGEWRIQPSGDPGFQVRKSSRRVRWGLPGDIPVPADFDGDEKADIAVWRPVEGTWYILLSGGGFRVVSWGLSQDIAIPADFDGDEKADIAVWRPVEGNWYILLSGGGSRVIKWGQVGDTPVPADFDGDGKADIAVWQNRNGLWLIAPP